MSSFLSRKNAQAGVRIDESLALRVKELQDTLNEHEQLVAEGCSVLANATSSLSSVRAKYEPVKAHAAALSSTSTNTVQISSDLVNLANSLRVHYKVRRCELRPSGAREEQSPFRKRSCRTCSPVPTRLLTCTVTLTRARLQLDKATQRAGSDTDLTELLSALEDTIKNNEFLLKFDQLEIALSALAKNRESTAHAARACAASFDRIIKAHSTVPPLPALEAVLSKPPSGAPAPRAAAACERSGAGRTLSGAACSAAEGRGRVFQWQGAGG